MRALALALIAWLILLSYSNASTFQVVSSVPSRDNTTCNVRLVGEIVPGDLARLIAAASEFPTRNGDGSGAWTLCLSSPGGDYQEGLGIAKYLMAHDVTTMLEPSVQCYSACAIIFMAGGFSFEGSFTSFRLMHKTASLGFHAPYIRGAMDSGSFATGVRAIRDLANAAKELHAQDSVMPTSLLAELLSKGPDEVFLIDTVFKAIQTHIRIAGVTSTAITTSSLGNACVNAHGENGTPDLSDPPAAWVATQPVIHRGNDYFFAGFGSEGVFYCVARFPDSEALYGFGISYEVRTSMKHLDNTEFFGGDRIYVYAPAKVLREIP